MAASDIAVVFLKHPIKLNNDGDYTVIKCRPFVDNNSPLAGTGINFLNLGANGEDLQLCVTFENVVGILYESAVDAFTSATYTPSGIQGYVDIS